MRHRIKAISDTPVKSFALCGAIYAGLAPKVKVVKVAKVS